MKSIRLTTLLIILLAVGSLAHAQYVENRTEYNLATSPYGLDITTEYRLNSILADIAERSRTQADIRFIAIDQSKIDATGYPITLETYRDAMLESLDEFYRQSREVFVIIWVADQDRIWISIPERAFERISLPLVQHIIDQEYFGRLGNGENRQDTIFETVAHLGRYLALATDTYPEYNQNDVPSGVWPYYDYAIHSMIIAPKVPAVPNLTVSASNQQQQVLVNSIPSVTEDPEQSGGKNQLVIVVVLIIIVLLLVLVGIRIKKNRSQSDEDDEYIEDYDDEDDEYEES